MVRQAGGEPVLASRDPAATAALHGVEAVAFGPRGLWAAARCDGVCVGPGGIVQDATSIWSLPAHLGAALTARALRKPVIGLGLGAAPLRRGWSRRLLRRALAGWPVTVRDRASADALAAAGVAAEIAPDLAFSLGLEPRPQSGELVVAVGPEAGAGLLSTAARRLRRAESSGGAVADGEVRACAAALDRLALGHGLRVVFTAFRGERDRRHAERVAAAMSQPSTLASCTDAGTGSSTAVDAVVERVLGAAALVAGRYHAAVVGLCGGVPVVAIGPHEAPTQAKLAALASEVVDPARISTAHDWASLEIAPGRLGPYRPQHARPHGTRPDSGEPDDDPSRRAVAELVQAAAAAGADGGRRQG